MIIKAQHSNFSANASSGISVKFSLEKQDFEQISAFLNGPNSTTAKVGEYKELGFTNIYYGKLDITNAATIKYSITNGTNSTFNTSSELETYINTLPAGTYSITYDISYLSQNLVKTRRVILN